MSDKAMLIEILQQTLDAAQRVTKRFEPVTTPDYFTDSDIGMEKLDAICMLLIAIGESIKKIDKITDKAILPMYPQVDWKGVKGLRDIISHHYFDIDAEEIYWVCETQLSALIQTLKSMISDIEGSKSETS